MAQILGLTVTDFPYLRAGGKYMAGVVLNNMEKTTFDLESWRVAYGPAGWTNKPHLRDPNHWPAPMLEAWGTDRGLSAGIAAQQRQIQQFRKLRAALDDFRPDFMFQIYREGGVFGNFLHAPYYIQAHKQLTTKFFLPAGIRENVFGQDPDRVDTLPGHPEGALYLIRRLQDQGFNPAYTRDAFDPMGRRARHNLLAGQVHLDWDRLEFKTPVVPMAFAATAFGRTHNNEGNSTINWDMPRPLTPKEAFAVGRAIGRIYHDSPWRVAIVACDSWSKANSAPWDANRIHPDVDADRRRYEEWKNGQFTHWGESWTFQEMEAHAQWELLVAITLAGTMTEIGSKVAYSDFQPNWLFNDDFITTIFEPQ